MKIIIKTLKGKDIGSIGIGAMIVFIAMVLVAGVAASVLIQTSMKLETQAMATGRETTDEISGGIEVFDALGYSSGYSIDISKIAIGVRPRAGSNGLDLSQSYIELADADNKVILNYTTSYFIDTDDDDGQDDIFNAACFPTTGSVFGIIVVEDADGSVKVDTPVINRGDRVYLCINATNAFNNIAERVDVWGMVVAELGSPGMIGFQTPASYTTNVIDLQ
jgi:flagellin FlaB